MIGSRSRIVLDADLAFRIEITVGITVVMKHHPEYYRPRNQHDEYEFKKLFHGQSLLFIYDKGTVERFNIPEYQLFINISK